MATIAEPSVMSLLVQMRTSGQSLATGTGFTAMTSKGPVLVTNRHNVTGRRQGSGQPLSPTGGVPDEIVINHNRLNKLGTWVNCVEPLYRDDGQARWVEHPVLGPRADFVALPLTQTDDIQLYPYDPASPGPNIAVGPADVLSVVGFPFGMSAGGALAVWATGFMASEANIDFDGLPVFLIDCRSRPGQSGSAVIAYRGGGMVTMVGGGSTVFSGPVFRFLGIYSGRINPESDIGMVWKASAIADLLKSI